MSIHLCIVHGRPQGERMELAEGEHVVGHGPECHIQPRSEWVSRQHCLFRVEANRVALRDLGSSNGTLLNGHPVQGEQVLTHGDLVEIGPLVFSIELDEMLTCDE